MLIIVVFVDVGIQNALQGVAAAAGLFKLLQLGQVRHKVKSKARVFQLQPIALPAGGNDFADFYVALGNLILAFGQHIVRMDMVVGAVTGLVDLFTSSLSVVGKGGLFYIPALIIIAGGDVVVMLIAQVAICKRQIVGIVSPTAVQRLAFADSAELILVHPICVLPAAVLGECGGLPGGSLSTAVHGRISAGNSKSAVTQRDNHAGGALYHIIFAEVKVCKSQPAILDFGAGYKVVFFQNGKIIGHPLPAVVADHSMPDGISVCIHDFRVVHHAGYAVRVGNILGGVEVIHRAIQRGIAVALPAGKGSIMCSFAAHISHGIKVNLGNTDFTQGAVIFHNTVCGCDDIVVLIGRLAAVVGVVGAPGVFGSIIDSDGGFYPRTGDKFCAAHVGNGNVCIVVGIVQPNHGVVFILGDFNIVATLAQRSIGSAGVVDIRPITEVAVGRFGFGDNKFAHVALGIVKGVPHGIRGCVSGAVDNGISAVILALDTVSVVATCGLIFAGYNIPLENFILRIGSNLIAGFAVGFLDVDLQRPFIIFHLISIIRVGRYRNCLLAAVAAPVHFKAIGYADFLIAEFDAGQFCFGRSHGVIYHALGFTLQFGNGRIAGAVGGCICFVLRGIGADTSAAAVGGFAYGVVQRPTCGCSTAVVLIIVIVGMAAGGYSLLVGGADSPCAAVNSTAFGDRLDFDGRAVHLFIGFKLHLVGDDAVVKIKAAACGLRRGLPVGVNFLHDGFGVRFVIGNFGANHGYSLPARAARLIDIGVVTTGGCVGVCSLQQRLRGPHKNFGGGAVGVILDNLHLRICIDRAAEIQQTRRFCGECNRRELLHTERKLGQTAPNSELVAVVVTGYILVCANHRSIDVSVRWAVLGLAVCAWCAAVRLVTIEPNQPSAVDFGDLGDFAVCYVGDRAFAVGSNTGISKRRCHRVFTVNRDIQCFGLHIAVRVGVDKLCGKIVCGLYIQTHDSGRCFIVAAVQQGVGISGGRAVEVQHRHAVRQDNVCAAAVCGILHLCHNGNNSIIRAVQQRRGHGKTVTIQRVGGQIAATDFFQLAFGPFGNADFGMAGGNRQPLAADIRADGRIGQIGVQFRADNGSGNFFFSGLFFCRFGGGFFLRAGVGAALIGLAVVCFRWLRLLFHLHNFLDGLRFSFFRKRRTGQHGAKHYRRCNQHGNAMP